MLILFAKQRKDCCTFSCPGTSSFQSVRPFMSHLVLDFNKARYVSTKKHYSVLRNVLGISFLRVAVVCAGSKHILSVSMELINTAVKKIFCQMNLLEGLRKCRSFFARYILYNNLQNRKCTPQKKTTMVLCDC